jgi:hypothetical protein
MPDVTIDALEAGYRAMAADEEHEREAMEWVGLWSPTFAMTPATSGSRAGVKSAGRR